MSENRTSHGQQSTASGKQSRDDNPQTVGTKLEPEGKRPTSHLPDRRDDGGVPAGVPGHGRGTQSSTPAHSSASVQLIENAVASINWAQAGLQRVTPEQDKILGQPVDPDWVEIKYPDIPYLPGVYYRKVLTDAFGRGGWALLEVAPRVKVENVFYLPCVLIAEGRPIAKAIGECEIHGNNSKLTDGDLMEACRTNAIVRACKHLGIAQEISWPSWVRKFKREHCREMPGPRGIGIVLARKDDEAGAKLFQRRIEDEEMSRAGGDPFIREFESHVESIWQEDDSWMERPIPESLEEHD